MSLQDEIADEYLPDIHVNGMDCPDTESAKEIINKVLDAVVEEFNEEADQVVMKGDYDEGIHDAHKIEAPRIINRLRPKS